MPVLVDSKIPDAASNSDVYSASFFVARMLACSVIVRVNGRVTVRVRDTVRFRVSVRTFTLRTAVS